MASSSRSGPRKPTVPTIISPKPRHIISAEEWDAKAPLGELELRSVAVLKDASEKQPLPVKFTPNDTDTSRPSTPRNRLIAPGPGSRPSTPNLGGSNNRQGGPMNHALNPKHPIQTPQQFYDWFALVERSVTHSQEAHFRAHIASVAGHLDACDELVERIEEIDSQVESMLDGWRGVEEGGKSLKDACERLLEERERLIELTEDIGARLDYFQELEHATRMLNHPGESLVLQTDFLYMVERVDICIDFLKSNRHFKEAEVYLLRFQQCMTRAMTLIRMFFVGSLRALSSDISKRLNDKSLSSTAQTHLLYTRFQSTSAQLAPLLGELERRSRTHPDELAALLGECHSSYFSTRKSLIVGRVVEEIKGLDPTRTELVELTRAGCSYLKQLCTDEFDLFREFFSTGEEQLYAYLENLCDYLYDDLRPRILHEPRLTALCEVCTVLQALMVLDITQPSGASASSSTLFSAPGIEDGLDTPGPSAGIDRLEVEDDETDELNLDLETAGGSRHRRHGLRRLHIAHLLQMVLQDAQTRLFFKAQSVIQAEIRYYAPKPEDLAYPDKLVGK
ncbi:hypothetical protein HGRIS_003127 [Hohenbuehelia grisea]|uniref:Conserved oligomeric Golgi complex subunit 3 n=1 Tax=Hohenbuehelia grisea TaxID=104357 RepID=A0ABR3JPN5_9AGAR